MSKARKTIPIAAVAAAPAANKPARNRSILGQSRIFTPEVIDDIHIKSELGRYRMRGFSKIGRAHV